MKQITIWPFPINRGISGLLRITWIGWFQERGFFFLLAFMWMMPSLVYLFVWTTAAGSATVGGLTRGEFVAYYLVLMVVNQLTFAQTNWTVGDVIRTGGLNRLLLRPLSPFADTIATELAGKGVYLLFVVPVVGLLTLVLRPEVTVTLSNLFAFFPALLLAWLLRFLWGYWLALLAFWSTRADALLGLQDTLVFLLAGQVAPVALLPGALQTVAHYLPFRYMIGFPVEIFTNQLTGAEIMTGFALQLGWIGVAFVLTRLLWRRGLDQYSAVGG